MSPAQSRSTFRRRNEGARLSAAWFALSLCLFAVVFSPRDAQAIERQHHLGLGPAAGLLTVAGKSTVSMGAGGAVHYAYGLTDQWNLSVEASHVIVAANQKFDLGPATPRNRPETVSHAAIGVGYVVDILRWVPYLDAHAGMYRFAGGTIDGSLFLPGVSVGAGLDYQLNRQFALGVGLREHLMVTKLDTYGSYTTALLRFEYMWGY